MLMPERLLRYLRNVHAPLDLIAYAGQLVEQEKEQRLRNEMAELREPLHSDFDPMWGR